MIRVAYFAVTDSYTGLPALRAVVLRKGFACRSEELSREVAIAGSAALRAEPSRRYRKARPAQMVEFKSFDSLETAELIAAAFNDPHTHTHED